MAKAWLIALAVVGVAGAGVAYYLLTRLPPGKYNLTVNAFADSTSVVIQVTVDSQVLATPGRLALDTGDYTVAVPDQITVDGIAYTYDRYEAI